MKKEELMELGLDEETAQKVADASAAELKGYIPKSRFDEVNSERRNLEGQLQTANDTLEDLKKNNVDNADLQKTIQEKDDAIKDLQTAHEMELTALRKDTAIESALLKARARNPKAVKALLDMDGLHMTKSGEVVGLEDRIKEIQESDGYLFGDGKVVGAGKPDDPREGAGSGESGKSFGAKLAEKHNEKKSSGVDPWTKS